MLTLANKTGIVVHRPCEQVEQGGGGAKDPDRQNLPQTISSGWAGLDGSVLIVAAIFLPAHRSMAGYQRPGERPHHEENGKHLTKHRKVRRRPRLPRRLFLPDLDDPPPPPGKGPSFVNWSAGRGDARGDVGGFI